MSDEIKKMPAEVSEDQIGITKEELNWKNLPDPRPPVSRWVFFFAGMAVIIACMLSGLWYYRTSIVPEKLFARAENYLTDGDYIGAYRLFEEVYEARPKRKDVIYNLGVCLEGMERFEAAANRYKEQIKKIPFDGRAMQKLGALYFSKLGKKEDGYALIVKGAEKLKTAEGWELAANSADGYKDKEEVISLLTKQLEREKEAESICAVSKRLYGLEAYKESLDGYEKALDKDENSAAAQDGIKAARTALGLPDSKEHTIIPGKALGNVEIGDDKEEVKKAMGGKSPEKKSFISMGSGKETEIWDYNLEAPDKFRIIFTDGKVAEIETGSHLYKTEEGLGIKNFDEERFAETFERSDSEKGIAIFTAREGGITFYAATRRGRLSDRYRKLRVYDGRESATDNTKGLTLLNLRTR